MKLPKGFILLRTLGTRPSACSEATPDDRGIYVTPLGIFIKHEFNGQWLEITNKTFEVRERGPITEEEFARKRYE